MVRGLEDKQAQDRIESATMRNESAIVAKCVWWLPDSADPGGSSMDCALAFFALELLTRTERHMPRLSLSEHVTNPNLAASPTFNLFYSFPS
jgi:hypothetical protein